MSLLNMVHSIIRRGLVAPTWLRPCLAFLLFWQMPLAGTLAVMAALGRNLSTIGIRALIYISVAGAVAALVYGLINTFLYLRRQLRPWVLAFASSTVYFVSMALISLSDTNTFARWEFAVAIIGGGTVFGGAVLRHFATKRSPVLQ